MKIYVETKQDRSANSTTVTCQGRLRYHRAARGDTHGGAPTVLNMVVNAPTADRRRLAGPMHVMTGAAATRRLVTHVGARFRHLPRPCLVP
jgi:hypothetical protein